MSDSNHSAFDFSGFGCGARGSYLPTYFVIRNSYACMHAWPLEERRKERRKEGEKEGKVVDDEDEVSKVATCDLQLTLEDVGLSVWLARDDE